MPEPQKTTNLKTSDGTGTSTMPSRAPSSANGITPRINTGVGPFRSTDTPTSAYKLPRANTNIQWGIPLGENIRGPNDENLTIFRRAVGINSDLARNHSSPGTLEQGIKKPTGIYFKVIEEQRRRSWQHFALSWTLNISHFFQVVIGATLTALGPNAARFSIVITFLGAINTVIAGALALLKGQGLPERLHKDEMEFRKLQDWIEETETLLAMGVIGRDRKEVGVLVESAFMKYNSTRLSKENNRPENYVPDPGSGKSKRASSPDSDEESEKAVTK